MSGPGLAPPTGGSPMNPDRAPGGGGVALFVQAQQRCFARDGFARIDVPVVDETVLRDIGSRLDGSMPVRAGSRRLLDNPWCRALAGTIAEHPLLVPLLHPAAKAILCILFDKRLDSNWLAPWHQDIHVPMPGLVDDPRYSGWSTKEGIWFAAAPREVLEGRVAVRLAVDDCTERHGPLRVLRGTHAHGILDEDRVRDAAASVDPIDCVGPRGGVVVMRPLLVHASSKATASTPRRVLHFVYVRGR
jgi:hypothetical protein